MSENEKEMTLYTQKESKIAPWGDRSEVREIAKRVQLMVPGGKKLTEQQALALAQGAVAHGLDPFNGEIWYIPGSGLMTGIKGLRKAAKKQIEGNYWTEFDRISDPDERTALFIPEGALAFRCIIRDSETIMAYAEAWKKLAAENIPADVIPTIIGKRPYIEGVGYFKKDESTKMDPVQVAMKRAEADATKRRFDLPFAIPSEPNDEIIDGEWYEAEELTSEEIHDEGQKASEDLFGPSDEEPVETSSDERPYLPEIAREKVESFYDHEEFKGRRRDEKRGETMTLVTAVVVNLEKCFEGNPDPGRDRHTVLAYLSRGKSTSIKDDFWTGAKLCAIEKWLEAKEWDGHGSGYIPRKESRLEAASMVVAQMKEQGQQELL